MLKALEKELSPLLTKVFQSIWTERTKVPQEYKDAKVVSLFKKGLKTEPNNYRSIFMLEAEGKLLCKTIKSRVESRTDHKLDNFQFRFRKGRSTLQAIWGVREIIQDSRESREELVMVFIDLVKAFDSVDGEAIRSLKAFEVENPLRSLIWQIHENAHGELHSKIKFKSERGVTQGCVIGSNI